MKIFLFSSLESNCRFQKNILPQVYFHISWRQFFLREKISQFQRRDTVEWIQKFSFPLHISSANNRAVSEFEIALMPSKNEFTKFTFKSRQIKLLSSVFHMIAAVMNVTNRIRLDYKLFHFCHVITQKKWVSNWRAFQVSENESTDLDWGSLVSNSSTCGRQ